MITRSHSKHLFQDPARPGLLVASWNPGCGPHPWPWSAPQGGATSRCPTSKNDRPVRPCVSREGWGWGSARKVESLPGRGYPNSL